MCGPSQEDRLRTNDEPERPLRVMHVVGVLALAGLEYGVIKQVNRLDPTRFAPSICCLYSQAEETRQALDPRIPVFELRHQAGRNRRLVARLAEILRRENVDFAHSHNWTSYYPTVLAARLAGVPFVVHGEHGRETAQRSDRRLSTKRLLALGVTRFVAVSPELALELAQDWRVPLERVAFIPNGVDLVRFHPDVPRRIGAEAFGFPPGARIVTIIGGIRPVKDHATLIRAFAGVLARRPLARLLVVGTDHGRGLQAELAHMAASLGIAHSVHFAGVRPDTPELLALSDVYVNSSVSEGMSNTILEAMAAGRPVVATSVGGNCELVLDGETGFLVPAGDSASLARRIEQVLGDPELAARLGKAGRARVERRHRMERMVEEYENLYLDLWHRRRLRRKWRWRELSTRITARAARSARAIPMPKRPGEHGLSILRYHRVLPLARASAYPFPGLVTSRDVFAGQMARLLREYRPLPLDQGVRLLREGALPRRAVVVTLEDGYRDAYEEAWPILRRFGIPATLLLDTGVLDSRRRPWWDEIAEAVCRLHWAGDRAPDLSSLPEWALRALRPLAGDVHAAAARLVAEMRRCSHAQGAAVLQTLLSLGEAHSEDTTGLMLSWDEAREMAREGITIGAQVPVHADLGELGEEETYREVSSSVTRLSVELQTPIRWLACPCGHTRDLSEEILIRAGIEAVLTGESGLNAPGAPTYFLRTTGAELLRLEGGFDPAVFDAGLGRGPRPGPARHRSP